jgi:multidrug transporter EmrE-like cation transporter
LIAAAGQMAVFVDASQKEKRMQLFYTLASVAGYILASVGSGLLFRVAAQHTGRMALLYFILGNCVGLGVSISLTLALRNTNPNLIFAACLGGAFCALQLASTLIFKQPLAPVQWVGVSLVAIGLTLLPFK